MRSWLSAFWTFARPHTVIGTTVSVISLFLLAMLWMQTGTLRPWLSADGPMALGSTSLVLALAWIACISGNIYIVGLNQLTDIPIDRINKPHLPLASGAFSLTTGRLIVALAGAIALLLSLTQGQFLALTVWLSLLIGSVYSLPPIRLKRFPLWASICIFSVRGVIVNLGLFLHFNARLNQTTTIPAALWVLTAFVLVFTFAIAIFKDIPDLEGDREYQISTFTMKLGSKTVFNLARWVITSCYVGMMAASLVLPGVIPIAAILFHGAVLALFWVMSVRVELGDKGAIARFYQLIWKLFFVEYLIFPWLYSR